MSRARAASVALALSIAACTSTPPPQVPLTPVKGGTLAVAVRDLRTLDPAKAPVRAHVVLAQIYDSLTAIDPDTGRVVPSAARSWKASKNGLRWLFRLDNARYSDGTRVRAADFAFSFSRIASKRTASPAAYTLEQVDGYGAAQAGRSTTLSGVKARSLDLLEITLERPFAELPYLLAHPALAPLPSARYTKTSKGLERGAVTNGPFAVRGVKLGSDVTLERFDKYRGAKTYLDRIRFVSVADVDAGWRDFQAGKVDVAAVPASALPTAQVDRARGGFTSAWGTLSFGPNLSLAKYAKVEVRRAISLAIDRPAIAQNVYGGAAAPATGIIPPGVRGSRGGACKVCDLDRDRARNIVRAAFKRPPSITIDHLAGAAHRKLAQAIQAGLEEIGFVVRLRAHTPTRYVTLLKSGKHDLAELGWSVDVPSPDGFLANQLRQGSPDNFTGFEDARFDRSVDAARRTLDDPDGAEQARLRRYISAEGRALSLMPLIPIVFVQNTTAVAARVQGFNLDGAGVFDGSVAWVS